MNTTTVSAQENKKTTEIYDKLFCMVKKNMSDAGKELPCSAESFVAAVETSPKKIDIGKLESLEGNEYATALYLAVFQKLPPKSVTEHLLNNKKDILQNAMNDPAFSIRGLEVYNHPYGNMKVGLKNKLLSKIVFIKNSVFLRKMAKKMPGFIQKKIRRMFT